MHKFIISTKPQTWIALEWGEKKEHEQFLLVSVHLFQAALLLLKSTRAAWFGEYKEYKAHMDAADRKRKDLEKLMLKGTCLTNIPFFFK